MRGCIMAIVRVLRPDHPLRIWLGIVLLAIPTMSVWAAEPEETTKFDCGVNALHVLLNLEGRPATVDRLLSALPARHPDGYSMAELAAASKALGLDLDGVRFSRGDKPLTRPAIVFLNDAKGGHFAVLRPVGTTGTMVQVIDPPAVPWIADYDRVVSTKSWTGRILTPREPWALRHARPLLIASVGVVVAAMGFLGWKRTAVRHAPALA